MTLNFLVDVEHNEVSTTTVVLVQQHRVREGGSHEKEWLDVVSADLSLGPFDADDRSSRPGFI